MTRTTDAASARFSGGRTTPPSGAAAHRRTVVRSAAESGVRRLTFAVAVILGLLGPVTVVSATILVPMSDADLVRTSTLIVVGEVRGTESVELDDGRIVTRVTLGVEETLKGGITGDTLVVTEPGGQVGDRGVWVFGAPRFVVGELALVFLRRAGDGTLRTNGLALGKYAITGGTRGEQRARRALPTPDVRGLDDFLATVDALVRGQPGREDVPPADARSGGLMSGGLVVERFTYLGPPGQLPARWFEADRGEPVRLMLANSDVSLGRIRTEGVVADALAAWTSVTTAAVVLENGGSTVPARSTAGGVCDDRSKIQFNDPFNEIADLNLGRCTGVFAVGGFCAEGPAKKVGSTWFLQIREGDATINNDVGRCVGRVDLTETVAHELGHVIGLGHSSEKLLEPSALYREALMYAFAHHDGRGAALNADDITGVSTLYPVDDADGDGVPDSRDACPATPAGFVVDAAGCACMEAGSAGCDDANACTVDHCNDLTGACGYDVVACDDGEPCTVDRCEPATGQCANELAGDSDGDGLCDPIDNCPLMPDADPTDLNGDGVGDVCECADEKPGRCVPGRGPQKHRCFVEWLPAVAPGLNKAGLPSSRVGCRDGDAGCDDDLTVDGQCTFRVALCVNNQDPRFPQCRPSTIARLQTKSPKPDRPKDLADELNAMAIGGAIDLGSQSLNRCSGLLRVVVPIRETKRGMKRGVKRLKVLGVTDAGRRGKAKLKLVCDPGAVPTN